MLMSKPYFANAEVATVLAQICCHKNKLPQGAPTSPIVSNMICARLDAQLRAFAREKNCYFTRYCDDITFSTNQSKFPDGIASIERGETREIVLGRDLLSIIEGNGFRINDRKTRLLSRSDRQDVTGLVTNKFPNVSRKYIRNLRAALHAWKKYGLEAFQATFVEKYCKDHTANGRFVLQGRIQFVGQIRGFDDPVYVALRDKFNALESERKIPIHQGTWEYKLNNAIWVIEDADKKSTMQGTAFFAEGLGIITCAHCVGKKPFIYLPGAPAKRYPLKQVASEKTVDLAILELEGGVQLAPPSLAINFGDNPRREQEISVAGYPNHGPGKQMNVETSEIASLMVRSGVEKFNVTGSIPAGMSGAPVFDRRKKVIGVAATGSDHDPSGKQTDERSVIRIAMLKHLTRLPE